MNKRTVQLDPLWLDLLEEEFDQPYMLELSNFLREQKTRGHIIYPSGDHIFAALNTTPFDQVKVVILGQDPYHGVNQAHGLSFSVPVGVPIPPSLINIYKELQTDLDCQTPNHGNLTNWAEQGVLLLNSVLTVEHARPASHQGKGWEEFTDRIVRVLNDQAENLVFLLWGAYAQRKGRVIDSNKHLVLKGPHPSPLSAYRGFFGCRHFSQTNQYLQSHGKTEIDWQIR
ncbi:MAG: uracil-DNA glycosylase [Acidiferrobacterales bacterium]|nr:uracil-DNA glycosylase [Acidiferrobacterales bacterium]